MLQNNRRCSSRSRQWSGMFKRGVPQRPPLRHSSCKWTRSLVRARARSMNPSLMQCSWSRCAHSACAHRRLAATQLFDRRGRGAAERCRPSRSSSRCRVPRRGRRRGGEIRLARGPPCAVPVVCGGLGRLGALHVGRVGLGGRLVVHAGRL